MNFITRTQANKIASTRTPLQILLEDGIRPQIVEAAENGQFSVNLYLVDTDNETIDAVSKVLLDNWFTVGQEGLILNVSWE